MIESELECLTKVSLRLNYCLIKLVEIIYIELNILY